jgi:hypothetical protein
VFVAPKDPIASRAQERIAQGFSKPDSAPIANVPTVSVPFTPAVNGQPATPAFEQAILQRDRKATIWISPRLVHWTVRLTAVALFVFLFLPWVGMYPGGYGVYTQTGLQVMSGGVSVDPVGVKALNSPKPFDELHGNGVMLLYVLMVVIALILVIGPVVLDAARIQSFPAFAQFFWRRRLQALGLVGLVALTILITQLSSGFGLETAVAAKVDKNLAPELAAAKTPEEQQVVNIHRAVEMAPYNLSQTTWLRLAVLGHIVLLVGIGLEYWLQRRGTRPFPRIEAHA